MTGRLLLAALLLSGAAHGQISGSGLRLRLNFEGTGQTVSDSSGNGNDCRLGSTAGADANDPARISTGLQFDGGDFVDCLQAAFGSTSLFSQASESYTIQVVAFEPSDETGVFAARATSSQRVFELGSESSNGVRGTLRGTATTIESPTPVNSWRLWTVRWNGTSAAARMDQGADVTLAAGSATNNSENLALGARSISTGGEDFLPNGSKIALVLIYDRALADSEMRRQYCAIRDYAGSKAVELADANCPAATLPMLSGLAMIGAPTVVAGESSINAALTVTDCAAYTASLWAASDQPLEPFEVAAGDTQMGDACNPFDFRHPVRQ